MNSKGSTQRSSGLGYRLATVAVVTLLVLTGGAAAQPTANASATATVQTALAVTVDNNLLFGNVLQGIPKSIGNDDDDSTAQFSITGQASAGVNIDLTLPEYLVKSDGSANMPIVFAITDATIDTTTATPSTATDANGWADEDPYNLPGAAVIGSGGTTNVYLGGRVVPSATQASGSYSADIILRVAYNGS